MRRKPRGQIYPEPAELVGQVMARNGAPRLGGDESARRALKMNHRGQPSVSRVDLIQFL